MPVQFFDYTDKKVDNTNLIYDAVKQENQSQSQLANQLLAQKYGYMLGEKFAQKKLDEEIKGRNLDYAMRMYAATGDGKFADTAAKSLGFELGAEVSEKDFMRSLSASYKATEENPDQAMDYVKYMRMTYGLNPMLEKKLAGYKRDVYSGIVARAGSKPISQYSTDEREALMGLGEGGQLLKDKMMVDVGGKPTQVDTTAGLDYEAKMAALNAKAKEAETLTPEAQSKLFDDALKTREHIIKLANPDLPPNIQTMMGMSDFDALSQSAEAGKRNIYNRTMNFLATNPELKAQWGTAQDVINKRLGAKTPTPTINTGGLPIQRNIAPSTPPVSGARLGNDGRWYVSDPKRPGKFLRVE